MRCRLNCFQCPYPDCIANGDRQLPKQYAELSEESLDRIRSEKLKKYYDLKEKGICTNCMVKKATNGILCVDCYTKKRNRKIELKRIREEFREKGLCIKCGAIRDENSAYCNRHKIQEELLKERKRMKEGIKNAAETA